MRNVECGKVKKRGMRNSECEMLNAEIETTNFK